MRVTRSVVLGLAIAALATPLRAQTTLGFEGLSGDFVPQGYGGFTWVGGGGEFSWVLARPNWVSTPLYRPSSGIQNAWANNGTYIDMITASATLFDFNSVFLSGASLPNGACGNVSNVNPETVQGFLGGVQLYTSTVITSCSTMQQFTFNFLGVDQVRFDQQGGWNLLVDDITINSTVPEPASLALFATGLLGLIPAARRKFNI